jgi:hypothetical protein
MAAKPCQCGEGFRVLIIYPDAPAACVESCTCTVASYKTKYGEPSFKVQPIPEN